MLGYAIQCGQARIGSRCRRRGVCAGTTGGRCPARSGVGRRWPSPTASVATLVAEGRGLLAVHVVGGLFLIGAGHPRGVAELRWRGWGCWLDGGRCRRFLGSRFLGRLCLVPGAGCQTEQCGAGKRQCGSHGRSRAAGSRFHGPMFTMCRTKQRVRPAVLMLKVWMVPLPVSEIGIQVTRSVEYWAP